MYLEFGHFEAGRAYELSAYKKNVYRVSHKKVFPRKGKKMQKKKMKMTLQREKNLVHVHQHRGVSFYKKLFSIL